MSLLLYSLSSAHICLLIDFQSCHIFLSSGPLHMSLCPSAQLSLTLLSSIHLSSLCSWGAPARVYVHGNEYLCERVCTLCTWHIAYSSANLSHLELLISFFSDQQIQSTCMCQATIQAVRLQHHWMGEIPLSIVLLFFGISHCTLIFKSHENAMLVLFITVFQCLTHEFATGHVWNIQ